MAPGRAESDFGQQGWIDTLGLKQIFSISSVGLTVEIKLRFQISPVLCGSKLLLIYQL